MLNLKFIYQSAKDWKNKPYTPTSHRFWNTSSSIVLKMLSINLKRSLSCSKTKTNSQLTNGLKSMTIENIQNPLKKLARMLLANRLILLNHFSRLRLSQMRKEMLLRNNLVQLVIYQILSTILKFGNGPELGSETMILCCYKRALKT